MKKIALFLTAGLMMAAPAWAEDGKISPPPPLMDELASPKPVVPTISEQPREFSAEKPAVVVEPLPPDVSAPAFVNDAAPLVTPYPVSSAEEKQKPKSRAAKKTKKSSPPPVELTSEEKTEDVLNTLLQYQGDLPALLLGEAMDQSYRHNPTLRAARAQVKAVFERVPQALANYQPNVTASAAVTAADNNNDPGADTSGTEKTAAVNLTQPVFRGGRTVAAKRAADALVDAQLAALATTERRILFQTAQSYMDVMRAQANAGVNKKNRDVIQRQLSATRDRFRVGDVTSTDVAQAEFRLAQAEADLIAALGVFRIARASFEQVVGVIPDRLTLPEQKFSFPVTIDESVTMAETYNPDVIAAEARHFAAKNNIDVEAGALLPEINLNAGLSMNRDGIGGINDRSDGGQVGVRASVPLYEGGAIRSRVREAKYTANELYMRTLEAKRAAREETVRAFENLNTARAELISRVAQVRAAEVARNGVRQEVDLGQRTILDALDAELEVRDAQIALIDAKRNEVVASFALASALGLLLPGNVGITDLVFDTNRFGWRTLTSGLTTAADTEPEEGR